MDRPNWLSDEGVSSLFNRRGEQSQRAGPARVERYRGGSIGITYWTARTFRMVARTLVVLAFSALAPTEAGAQLRPLDPVDFQAFHGAPVRVQVGGGFFLDQHASLAGTRGTLWEVGEFRATIRTGRMVMELGGTVQRLFRDDEVLFPPFGDAAPPTDNGHRHDAGDYRVGAVVRLTPDASSTLATLRFGTRLPTTDNRVGLDRDAIDFYTTLAAHHHFGAFALAVEAGLGINGTRVTTYEQADVLLYAMTAEMTAGRIAPFLSVMGQQDFQEFPIRGNEDLSELRAGLRAGRTRWVNVAWVRGLTEYSPSNGLQLGFGMSFGSKDND